MLTILLYIYPQIYWEFIISGEGGREPPAAMSLPDLLYSTEPPLKEKKDSKKTNYNVNSIRFIKIFDLSDTFKTNYLCLNKSCNLKLLLKRII